MTNYYTRVDLMTQATATYNPVETGVDGSTAGPVATQTYESMIVGMTVAICLNADAVVTGANYVIKLHGTGMTEQEIVVASTQFEAGAGTLTDTDLTYTPAKHFPLMIPITPGMDVKISAAYVGTDPGTPFIAVTLEVN